MRRVVGLAQREIRFERFTDVASDDFRRVLEIYRASFPASERHADAVIEARVRSGANELHVARHQGKVVFFAMFWPFRGSSWTLFDYMATHPEHRGRGIGRAFLSQLPGAACPPGQRLVLEVENPAHGDNAQDRARRVSFYRSMGIRTLSGVRYILPPLSGPDPTEMILMVMPDRPGASVAGTEVRDVMVRLYAELYGRGREDPLLAECLKTVRDPVVVE